MKPALYLICSALVFLCAFQLPIIFPPNVTVNTQEVGHSESDEIMMLGMPSCYGIKVLVEPEGYYIGEELMQLSDVLAWIENAKHIHNVRSVMVKSSNTARHGDVVSILAALRKDKSYFSTIAIRPVPTGDRLNAWAYYKWYCCGSDDILADEYLSYIRTTGQDAKAKH